MDAAGKSPGTAFGTFAVYVYSSCYTVLPAVELMDCGVVCLRRTGASLALQLTVFARMRASRAREAAQITTTAGVTV